jgi:protein involved in polysaccharide export with SLBB domain
MIRRCICLATLVLANACQHIPDPTFDPRQPGTERPIREARLTTVHRSSRIDPDWLKPPEDAYQLGPGDLLEIEIAEIEGTLARTFVMPDGLVHYNLAGGVPAEGSTIPEFTRALTAALSKDYAQPLVNVSLVEVRSRRYWILGRVFNPGIFPLRQPTTLLEAISQSGGLFTSRFSGSTEELADLGRSVVVRDGKVLPVDFEALVRRGDTSQNIYLRHNDFIYLPSSQSGAVLLLGAVTEPQSIGYKDSLSLITALAYGKGPAEGAYLRKVVIVRGSLSEPQAATVDVSRILTGRSPDIRLAPGDIVWVPRSPFNALREGVELVIRDAARTIAVNEGAAAAGSDARALIGIPPAPVGP